MSDDVRAEIAVRWRKAAHERDRLLRAAGELGPGEMSPGTALGEFFLKLTAASPNTETGT